MPFACPKKLLYLCGVKRIEFISPVRWMRGSLSGRQDLTYEGVSAYDHAEGEISPDQYQPRLIAKVLRAPYVTRRKYFQVRTRSTVNMTATFRRNCALMGGVGAIYSSLVRDKSAQIYKDCERMKPAGKTLRAFLSPILRAGLDAKNAVIVVADGVQIVNPWISSDAPNVPVTAAVLEKFSSELSNT